MRPLNPKHRLLKHGGAGNQATATSDYLSLGEVQKLIAAASCALDIGKPLTRHLTVRLEQQGIPDKDAVKAIGRLTTLLRDHVRKTTDGEIAYIWTREYGATIGSHVHILLHLPAGYNWQGQRTRRWIERIARNAYKNGTIKTTRIGGTAKAYESNPGHYWQNLGAVVSYLIKGSSIETVTALKSERVRAQGHIIGKRCGASQSVSKP